MGFRSPLDSRHLIQSFTQHQAAGFLFDQRKAFIGSFNFDSRSLLWNTEVGVLVDNPQIVGRVRELALEGMAPALSYHTVLENHQMVWITEDDGKQHTLTGYWLRAVVLSPSSRMRKPSLKSPKR